jgi:hypothetical protein
MRLKGGFRNFGEKEQFVEPILKFIRIPFTGRF